MLNELKINHMGGAENYGVDDFYNIDDAWNDTKQPIKPKVSEGNTTPDFFELSFEPTKIIFSPSSVIGEFTTVFLAQKSFS